MGQRSQLYFKMENIGKAYFKSINLNKSNDKMWRDNVPGYMKACERYEKWKLNYGDEDTMIVGFHHQWLYGRTFALVGSMLLNINKTLSKDKYALNLFLAKNWKHGDTNLPRTINETNPEEGIRYLQDLMSNLFDFELSSRGARSGIQGYCLLNGEDDENPELITRFDMGDNNDGVFLMDFTKNKYCYIHVNGEGYKLKHLQPVDGHTYLKSYYAESSEDFTKEDLVEEEKDGKPIPYKKNASDNKKFVKRFQGFKTLTVEDLIDMFPAMESDLKEANKEVMKAIEV